MNRSSGSFELVGGSVLFALIGLLIDRATGITPTLTITFAVLGLVGATASIFYRYRESMRTHTLERVSR